MYRNMLVPLDGSELAEITVPYAREVAGRLGIEITFLHVCDSIESSCISVYGAYVQHAAESLGRGEKAVQLEPSGLPIAKPVKARGDVIEGSPAEGILRYAENNDIDLILMATHGHSGITHWTLGSVADKVVSASKKPVWLLPSATPREILYTHWPMAPLLVPLDGSKLAEQALFHAQTIATQRGPNFVEIVLLQVCEPPVLLADYPEAVMPDNWDEHVKEQTEIAMRGAKKYLNGIETQLKNKGLQVRSEVFTGKPADEIIGYADKNPLSVIVMSTHGRSGLSRWAYGSVAHKIIYGAAKPILMVRANTYP